MLVVWGAAPPAQARDAWRVGTWKTAQTIQPFVYAQFLLKQPVEVFPFTNPADQKMALLADSLEMCGTTLAHAIHSASRGEPVVVVAALCHKCSALVVKKDGPIQSVKDLAGKTIGYVPGTMHEILLRETLTRNGLNPDKDVKLTRVDFFDMGLALAGGSIDAFLSGEPFPTLAKMEGYGRVLAYPYYGESIGSINAGMLVKRETSGKSPEVVAGLVKAHAQATDFLKAHPDQWLERAAKFGTKMEVLKNAAPNMELAWDMDEAFQKKVAALGGRMKALGIISQEPDYGKLIDLRFVRQVKQGR
jgi:NitT/TauT family transport system substrate-binding protein